MDHGRDAVHLPVSLAVAFGILFQRKPPGRAQERLEQLAGVVRGQQVSHFQMFNRVKEIHEPVAPYGEAQFVEDRVHSAGALDFVSGGVPLPEDFEVGIDVTLIARVQGGPGQAIHPAEVMEAVFGLVAEPGVERDRSGEVDFDLSESPPTRR